MSVSPESWAAAANCRNSPQVKGELSPCLRRPRTKSTTCCTLLRYPARRQTRLGYKEEEEEEEAKITKEVAKITKNEAKTTKDEAKFTKD